MDTPTQRQLLETSRRFYERHAEAFDASRERPWRGWDRVLLHLPDTGRRLSVLDAGCGNGRLLFYLARRWQGPLRYVGIDSCTALLAAAQEHLQRLARGEVPVLAGAPLEVELRRGELLADDLEAQLGDERFDLVALFGVLHHVPCSGRRLSLLRRLGRRRAPGGLLAAAAWQLPRDAERYARRLVSWEEHNRERRRRGLPPIDLAQLDDGDVLLTWEGDSEAPRYCHFATDAEISRWSDALGTECLDRFEADGPSGRDNLYLIFAEPRSAGA